jgi:hypothetical protein
MKTNKNLSAGTTGENRLIDAEFNFNSWFLSYLDKH